MKSPTTQTHIVLKIADIKNHLNLNEQGELSFIIRKIGNGRIKDGKKIAEYLVINCDEPFAEEIHQLVEKRMKEKPCTL